MNYKKDLFSNYILKERKIKLFLLVFVLLLIILFFLFASMGKVKISFMDIKTIILYKLNLIENLDSNLLSKEVIMFNIRFPRIIISIFVGMGLCVSGVIFQSILSNPLADSYTIGVSTGCAFGAVLSLFINMVFGINLHIMFLSIVFGLITLAIVCAIANKKGDFSSSNLVIAGIIVSSILSSAISFIKNIAGEEVSVIVYWLMGSFSAKSWSYVYLCVPVVTIGIMLTMFFSNELNIISLGEEDSMSLGVCPKNTRKKFLIIGSIITAACVSVSGIIGFIGLVVPHMIRFSVTSNNKYVVPLSAIMGGILLLCADTFTRVLFASEIPVGVITTLLGGPFFIYIFMRK
ncbi:MAG: iron ABC transporter permease [Peptostreptococcaceae bacterium]|jgi:iron complex transport system permease protein|nr:iron ABC transporter permease [Peptostreptococcaceae bacterium]